MLTQGLNPLLGNHFRTAPYIQGQGAWETASTLEGKWGNEHGPMPLILQLF